MPGRKFPESFSIKKKSSELKEHPRPDEEVSEKDNKIQKISNTQLNDVVKTFELYIISGVQVNFPFKAYACQLNMMQKIMKSLNSEVQENALLESPTGSGKSLSLLCSVIAWHYHRKTLFEKDQNDMVIESKYTMPKITAVPDNSPIPSSAVDFQQIPFPKEAFQVSEEKSVKKLKSVKPPGKVYITSRTHKQISQLVKELRATPYQPKMSVLGSRSHLCLHESVLNSSDSNEECRKLLDTSGCKYFGKAEMLARNMRDTIWDIEDLVEAGRDHRACPYFAARTLSQEADIIFAPYNYVCDPGIRDAMSINLNNAVVVLDEAHNIEDAARESGSFTVDNEKLDLIAIELEGLRASCSKISDGPYAGTAKDLGPCYETMKSLVYSMVSWLKVPHQIEPKRLGDVKYYIFDETTILQEIARIDMTKQRFEIYKNAYTKMTGFEASVEDREQFRILSLGSNKALGSLVRCFEILFDGNQNYLADLRVVHIEGIFYLPAPKKMFKLAFWCLNPGVVFKGIADNVKSIILTSGTLSPMDSFASELQVEFPIRMEASHIIENSHVWVGAIGHGPTGISTSLYYKTADSFAFQDEIGKSLLSYLSVIPHGVLCFVPSYGFMKKLLHRWKETGTYLEISKLKTIIVEPQNVSGREFQETLDQFYEAIDKSKKREEKYGDASGGCFFIAVYRGKVSEGLDFIDDNARAVIAIGIPFPNLKDVQIELKKTYNDQFSEKRGLLTGKQWNEIQAYRALNQALGRCIRHRNDWGAIILFDQRFTQEKHRKNLSKWVREKSKSYFQFEESLYSLQQFMARWKLGVQSRSLGIPDKVHNEEIHYNFSRNETAIKYLPKEEILQASNKSLGLKLNGTQRKPQTIDLTRERKQLCIDMTPEPLTRATGVGMINVFSNIICTRCKGIFFKSKVPIELSQLKSFDLETFHDIPELTDVIQTLKSSTKAYLVALNEVNLKVSSCQLKTFGKSRTHFSLKYCASCAENVLYSRNTESPVSTEIACLKADAKFMPNLISIAEYFLLFSEKIEFVN